MIFYINAKDDPANRTIRVDYKVQHRAYLERYKNHISFAGPLYHNDGNGDISGSLLVIDFSDLASAEYFMENEPYNQENLFHSVEILVFENRWPQKTGFPKCTNSNE